MANIPTRREFLTALAMVAGSIATTFAASTVRRLWRSHRAAINTAAAVSHFHFLHAQSLRDVEIVVTGPQARFVQLPPAEWDRMVLLLQGIVPSPCITEAPAGYGLLQLLLVPSVPSPAEVVRLSWFSESSVEPRYLLHVGAPFDVLFTDDSLFPWLQSFTAPPQLPAT